MQTIRAEITKAEWRELRQIALELDVTVQQLVGDLIVEYLRKNGVEMPEAATA